MSSKLSASPSTAQTAITRMSSSRCSTFHAHRGSSIVSSWAIRASSMASPPSGKANLLHWPHAGEFRPIPLPSGGKTEDLVYKGPLRRHVVTRHGAHLALGQHRHRLHARQGAPRGPEALEPEHRSGPALDSAVILLDHVVEPATAPVPGEAPQLALPLHLAERAGIALEAIGHDLPRVGGVVP